MAATQAVAIGYMQKNSERKPMMQKAPKLTTSDGSVAACSSKKTPAPAAIRFLQKSPQSAFTTRRPAVRRRHLDLRGGCQKISASLLPSRTPRLPLREISSWLQRVGPRARSCSSGWGTSYGENYEDKVETSASFRARVAQQELFVHAHPSLGRL